MRVTVILLGLAAAGCYDPQITDGGFSCDPAEPKPCPDGYACRDVRGTFVCTRGPAVPPVDTGSAASGDDLAGAPVDDMAQPINCSQSSLVINEVLTGTTASASEEWIELYNPCGADVTFTGTLVYRAATSTSDSTVLATLASRVIPKQGYFLVASADYAGTADIKPFNAGGLAAAGAGLALRDGGGQLVTSMAWGGGTSNGFQNASPATAPGANQSAARTPDGANTHNDSVDFAVDATPTPRSANF
jgi:hypothetical protein